MNLKLGSLFDGSGTAPLAASMCGIDPVWASEIEPYPVKVTKTRFPGMKHLGSITDINGAEVIPVDIICGGSPCQDLSVAGKQAGLHNGERSHLFFEMTRIIKEMRGATNGKYPRYVIWENVPGAFSSNKGEDFLAVLQAFAEIADADVHVPRPESRGGRLGWKYAGEMVGNGWSIAWRTVDAQYWGVPQRRRRIYLVADFAGECADEILFERTGMSGNPEPSGTTREGTPAGAEGGSGADDRERRCFEPRSMKEENWTEQTTKNALRAEASKSSHVIVEVLPFDTTQVTSPQNGNNPKWGDPCHPLAAQGHPPTVICKAKEDNPVYCLQGNGIDRADTAGCNGAGWRENESYTLNTIDRHSVAYAETCQQSIVETQDGVTNRIALAVGNGQLNQISMAEQCNTLDCMHDKQAVMTYSGDISGTLDASYYKGTGARNGKEREFVAERKGHKYIIRRLTPLECCRLQGFPDWWEDGVEGSDSARYKMWGNGMALPNMLFVMQGIARMEKEIGGYK